MKKLYFYAMVIACLFCTATIHAQDRYWRLAPGTQGDWNNTANWAATPAGATGQTVPNGATFNVFFDQGATVNVNVGAITVNRITVSGPTLTRLIASVNSVITVQSNTAGSEGLRIEAGSTLESRCSAPVTYSLTFADGAHGEIDGTWDFTGAAGVNLPFGATFNLPAALGTGTRVDVDGQMIFRNNTRTPLPGAGPGAEYLFFNSGSTYQIDRNGGGTPQANWNANSTILITGTTNQFPSINLSSTPSIGHLTWNTPAMAPGGGSFELALNGMAIQGNLSVLNTNSQPLTLVLGLAATSTMTVGGNLNVSGTSTVYIGEDNDKSYDLIVGGNFNLSGGNFLMQMNNGVGTNSTVMSLRGNLNHTAGTLGLTSTDQSTAEDLFVIELDGTLGAQSITQTGTVADPNSMITLRLNNAAGATLATPATFGKISWNSAAKGILTTTAANVLSITNPNATNATVINAPANNGYVSGPIRRSTNSTDIYRFPTGKSNLLRYTEVIPATTAASVYTAEYFRTVPPNAGSVVSPLDGVTNLEYWNITRQSGSNAAVQLTFNAVITGADATDAIVVARNTASNWSTVRGTTGTGVQPGNSASGVVRSEELGAFAFFTLGFGPAGALPIDLVSFTAKKLSGSASLLNWSVTASSTPDRFEVLRSTDGNNFATIGTVQAVDQQLNYNYTDNSMPSGTIYYRLRLVDINGEVKLSKVVVITNGTEGLFLTSMAPTIVTSRARVTVTSSQRGSLQLVITDMYGRIVKQQINGIEEGSQEIWLNLHSLAGGAYQITGYIDGKRSGSIRFIK
jgi:hypothetical protein